MREVVYHIKFNRLNTTFHNFQLLLIFILLMGAGRKKRLFLLRTV